VQLVEVLVDQVGQAQQEVLALLGGERAPGPGKGLAGGRHGQVDVGLVPLSQGGDDGAGRGIDGRKGPPGHRGDPFPADEHQLGPVVQEGRHLDGGRLCGHESPFSCII
jgi:hypothetical protein